MFSLGGLAALTFLGACAVDLVGCQRAALRARPVVFRGTYDGPVVTARPSGERYTVIVIAPSKAWGADVDEADSRPLLHDVYVTLRRPAGDEAGVGEPVERRLATDLGTGKGLRVNVRVVGPGEAVTEDEPPYYLVETVSP